MTVAACVVGYVHREIDICFGDHAGNARLRRL
jgi:hypothetical protein